MADTHLSKLSELLISIRAKKGSVSQHADNAAHDVFARLKSGGFDVEAAFLDAAGLIRDVRSDLARVKLNDHLRQLYTNTLDEIQAFFSPLSATTAFNTMLARFISEKNIGILQTLDLILQTMSGAPDDIVPYADRSELLKEINNLRELLQAAELHPDVTDFCLRALSQIEILLASHGVLDRAQLQQALQSILAEGTLYKVREKTSQENTTWQAFGQFFLRAWDLTQKGRQLIGTVKDYGYLLGSDS